MHLGVRHELIEQHERAAQYEERNQFENQPADDRGLLDEVLRDLELRADGQPHRQDDDQGPQRDGGPIMNDPDGPVPSAGHAPDVIECRFDGAEQSNRDEDQRDRAGQTERAAVNVRDEGLDLLDHFLAGFILSAVGAQIP